jgi:hypothetical protein
LNRILLTYLAGILLLSVSAQTRKRNFRQSELGFYGGGSYYIGDINPRNHFKDSHMAGGLFYRFSSNYRFSFRFGFNYGSISGNDAASGEPDQIERNLNFSTRMYELAGTTEFNFVEYRIGHDRYKFTLFIFAGASAFRFNPISNAGTLLREQNSEAQSESYPRLQVSIPFGVGLKFNVGKKCGLGVEWGPRRTFTDYLDDIRGVYPDNGSSAALAGAMRGNPSTRDWYFYYGVTLNIKLREAHRQCHKGF